MSIQACRSTARSVLLGLCLCVIALSIAVPVAVVSAQVKPDADGICRGCGRNPDGTWVQMSPYHCEFPGHFCCYKLVPADPSDPTSPFVPGAFCRSRGCESPYHDLRGNLQCTDDLPPGGGNPYEPPREVPPGE